MKLYDAIKEIVKLKGKDIITDSALLNYLNDYHAFEDNPAFKQIVKSIIDNGYTNRILSINATNTDIALSTFVHDLVCFYGYNQQYAEYCVTSFAYAIEATKVKPEASFEVTSMPKKGKYNFFEFKHIPLVGKAVSFIKKLDKNGFTITCEYTQNNKQGILVGTVGEIKDCIIAVSGSELNDDLQALTIEFPPTKSWYNIKGLFLRLKEVLGKKYGEPNDSTEMLFPPYNEGDGNEDEALANFQYIYRALYKTSCGSIHLMIMNGLLDPTGTKFIKSSGSSVFLMYDDLNNNAYNSPNLITSLESDL